MDKNEEIQARDIHASMVALLNQMRQAKPEERSELARRYAVSITDLERVEAYFQTYVLDYVYKWPDLK